MMCYRKLELSYYSNIHNLILFFKASLNTTASWVNLLLMSQVVLSRFPLVLGKLSVSRI